MDRYAKQIMYRQIDFLRLFRLCKKMGYVKRKRKMPVQYDKQSYVHSSCSKLFKTFLTGLFEDTDIHVDTRRHEYTIQIPSAAAEALQFITRYKNFLLGSKKYADLMFKFEELSCNTNGFIVTPETFSYTRFKILSAPRQTGRYGAIVENIVRSYVGNIARPVEEYFRCATESIKYKEIWNRNATFLCNYVDEHREEMLAQVDKRKRVLNNTESRNEGVTIAAPRLASDRPAPIAELRGDPLNLNAQVLSESTQREQEHLRVQAQQQRENHRAESQRAFEVALQNNRSPNSENPSS